MIFKLNGIDPLGLHQHKITAYITSVEVSHYDNLPFGKWQLSGQIFMILEVYIQDTEYGQNDSDG